MECDSNCGRVCPYNTGGSWIVYRGCVFCDAECKDCFTGRYREEQPYGSLSRQLHATLRAAWVEARDLALEELAEAEPEADDDSDVSTPRPLEADEPDLLCFDKDPEA